jgi:hypothetical protein
MFFEPRRQRRALTNVLVLLLLLVSLPMWAAEKTRLRVDDYQIDAELTPHIHKISARAKVKFTALEDITAATFELNNGLRVTKVTDDSGQTLSPERMTQDFTVRVQLSKPLSKGSSTTLTFEYDGTLDSADDSPVQGLKLASINDDTSYLLYAGRWFPVNAYGINRFTATMNITVPAHMVVIGSGKETAGVLLHQRRRVPAPYPPKPSALLGTNRVSPGPSLRELFRSSRVTKPGSTCMSFSSRLTRTWARCTPRRQSRNSLTT